MLPRRGLARTLTLLGGAFLASASSLVAGVAQSNSNPATVCPAGVVCFFSQPNYQGTLHILDFAEVPGCRNAFQARSVINNQIHPVGLYVDGECTQYLDQVEAGGSRANLIAGVVTADG
ncbi:peptidase inhibitor family I36 protein [Streptomyces jumonjinensis]|uniref:Peptidase inhibitor family I36 protein n=1 Tax=Streptomyces jumonjinensis TaxID=1945 RepID=A0A646KQ87_STRJU|nr:hypothetical protein [Streptomyces jumonjinensis]